MVRRALLPHLQALDEEMDLLEPHLTLLFTHIGLLAPHLVSAMQIRQALSYSLFASCLAHEWLISG